MRFIKIYLGTLIIILILAIFLYALSFVYVKSVSASLGTSTPIAKMNNENSSVVFTILDKEIEIDKQEINSAINKVIKYMPTEIKETYKGITYIQTLLNKKIVGG